VNERKIRIKDKQKKGRNCKERIRKVKTLRRPKIDILKMNEMYSHPKSSGRKEASATEAAEATNELTKELRAK